MKPRIEGLYTKLSEVSGLLVWVLALWLRDVSFWFNYWTTVSATSFYSF